MKIPGAERAIVGDAKVRDYLLSAEHRVGSAKAKFFVQLGFEPENWPILRDALGRFATGDAQLGAATSFGQKYTVSGTIQGPLGRSAQVVVVWIVLHGEDYPRFVTAFPGPRA